jgi:hypothetical protein
MSPWSLAGTDTDHPPAGAFRPGFACSCHDLKTSGAVHKSFIVKLSANWLADWLDGLPSV